MSEKLARLTFLFANIYLTLGNYALLCDKLRQNQELWNFFSDSMEKILVPLIDEDREKCRIAEKGANLFIMARKAF